MPLQRLLTIYLAAVAFWIILSWVISRIASSRRWLAPMLPGLPQRFSYADALLGGLSLDPASPVIPPVSLYSVAMSARPEQVISRWPSGRPMRRRPRYRSVGSWVGAFMASATLGAALDRAATLRQLALYQAI